MPLRALFLCFFLGLNFSHSSFVLRAEGEPKSGDVVFDLNALDRATLKLPSEATWCNEGEGGTSCLKFTAAEPAAKGSFFLSIPFDIVKYRGMQLALLARCRTENLKVTDPRIAWIGSKFQLHWKSPTTGAHYLDSDSLKDTTPWSDIKKIAMVDEDAESGIIRIGVQNASGTAWFSQARISILKLSFKKRGLHPDFKPSKTTLRGVMSPTKFNEKDFEDLEKWNANLIRWQLVRNWGKANTDMDLDEYDKWFNGKLDELALVLDSAQRHGIGVVIDIHSPPGGRDASHVMRIFTEKKFRDHFIKIWERIAQRFGGHPAIWAYDIINEPVQFLPTPEVPEGYLGVEVAAAKAIRAIDPKTPVIIAPDEWSSPTPFKWLEPVDISNVIYQVHMYWPGEYTHQGVHNSWGEKSRNWQISYPGMCNQKMVDKEALRRTLQPVLDFQKAYNARIYVGEFSAARWAAGAAQYIDDCISIFEEYGWDWTYHAFRESNIWSVEHVNAPRENPTPSKEPTDRELVLKKWLSKNRRYPDRAL